MQLFGHSNNIYLCTSNSITTGTIYFRNQIFYRIKKNDFASFSQTGSIINSSFTLNNALTCKNISLVQLLYF